VASSHGKQSKDYAYVKSLRLSHQTGHFLGCVGEMSQILPPTADINELENVRLSI